MRSLRSVLLVGGAGFVGSSLVRHLLGLEQLERLVVLDKLVAPGDRQHLTGPDHDPRFSFVEGDMVDRPLVLDLLDRHQVTGVFNLAGSPPGADLGEALQTTMTGTALLLEACKAAEVTLVQGSSTEVYGSIPPPDKSLEADHLAPASREAALQAGADHLCRAAFAASRQEVMVARASRTYGPRQRASELIPTLVRNALHDQPSTLRGGGLQVRDWIHVDDHCRGLLAIFRRGRPGELYNLGGNCERTTIGLARSILQALGKPGSLLLNGPVHLGDDLRQAVHCTKALGNLGWSPQVKMPTALPGLLRSLAADLPSNRPS